MLHILCVHCVIGGIIICEFYRNIKTAVGHENSTHGSNDVMCIFGGKYLEIFDLISFHSIAWWVSKFIMCKQLKKANNSFDYYLSTLIIAYYMIGKKNIYNLKNQKFFLIKKINFKQPACNFYLLLYLLDMNKFMSFSLNSRKSVLGNVNNRLNYLLNGG